MKIKNKIFCTIQLILSNKKVRVCLCLPCLLRGSGRWYLSRFGKSYWGASSNYQNKDTKEEAKNLLERLPDHASWGERKKTP